MNEAIRKRKRNLGTGTLSYPSFPSDFSPIREVNNFNLSIFFSGRSVVDYKLQRFTDSFYPFPARLLIVCFHDIIGIIVRCRGFFLLALSSFSFSGYAFLVAESIPWISLKFSLRGLNNIRGSGGTKYCGNFNLFCG